MNYYRVLYKYVFKRVTHRDNWRFFQWKSKCLSKLFIHMVLTIPSLGLDVVVAVVIVVVPTGGLLAKKPNLLQRSEEAVADKRCFNLY